MLRVVSVTSGGHTCRVQIFLQRVGAGQLVFPSEVSHRFQESLQRYLLVHDPPQCTWLKLT